METVISSVVALCMFVAGELTEHRIQPAMSDCLKGKRVAERTANDNIEYKCGKVEAELEENIDGSKAILPLANGLPAQPAADKWSARPAFRWQMVCPHSLSLTNGLKNNTHY